MATISYKVIQAFTDLKDDNRVYRVGDVYVGTDEERIKELLSNDNKGRHESLKDKPLIALDGEEIPEIPEIPEAPEADGEDLPKDEPKAKKGKK
jgi:hypothetical protein